LHPGRARPGPARHRRPDRGAQGAASHRQRGHPRVGAGRGPRRGADLSRIDFAKLRDEFASIGKADRERLKQASRALLASLRDLLRPMHDWTQNTATQAEVQVFILDNLWHSLPRPPFSDEETEAVASRVYDYVWQRSASGLDLAVV
jgi:hypothetical protein